MARSCREVTGGGGASEGNSIISCGEGMWEGEEQVRGLLIKYTVLPKNCGNSILLNLDSLKF